MKKIDELKAKSEAVKEKNKALLELINEYEDIKVNFESYLLSTTTKNQ